MATSIIITDQKFFNEYKNDPGFVSNLGDFTPNLAASVGGNVKVTRTIQVSWAFSASASNPLLGVSSPSAGVLQFILPSSKTWANEDFAIGDTLLITYTDNAGAQSQTGTVTSINGSLMILTWTGVGINGWINNSTTIIGTNNIEALVYGFGLVDNNETTIDIASKVSGNDQQYYTDGIGLGGPRSTSFVNMQSKGQYLDWVTGSARVRFVSAIVSGGQNVAQIFEIEHIFRVVPYFIDGELTNLQNNVIPPDLAGQNSYKYISDFEFRIVLNNSNTKKQKSYNENLGDVAWFNENFNGFNAEYKVNSITYEEEATGNPADGLLIGTKTTVKMEVEALNRVFVAGDNVGIYVSLLPLQAAYTNTTLSDQTANFMYDRAFQVSGSSGAAGDDFITAFAVFAPAGSIMNLEFDVEYSPTQKATLAAAANLQSTFFSIGVELGDNTLASAGADRLILLADVEEYDESPDIPGLMEVTDLRLHPHNVPVTPVSGFTSITQWIEDGFAAAFEFELNLNKDAVINTLEFQLLAHNPLTGQLFVLDTYNYANIGTAIVSGGVQQLFENTTRGYNLAAGDQFNLVTITTGAQAAGFQKYSGVFGQKISWQDWIANVGVDPIFFDNSKPNDNMNLKASNYANMLNDYEIKLGISASVDGTSVLNVSGTTQYLSLSPAITVHDYDVDGNITPVWSAIIETFHPVTAVNLLGKVLTGLNTVMKTTWVNSLGPIASVASMYAIHRAEEFEQSGYSIDELSTILPFPTPNLPIPLLTETELKIDPIAGDVVTEGLIDGSQVVPGKQYNLSARLDDSDIPGGKITETLVQKDTEDSDSKIIE